MLNLKIVKFNNGKYGLYNYQEGFVSVQGFDTFIFNKSIFNHCLFDSYEDVYKKYEEIHKKYEEDSNREKEIENLLTDIEVIFTK